MRFSTWNVRSMCRPGPLKTVARELARHRLDLVGAQKVGQEGTVQVEKYIYILYLNQNENQIRDRIFCTLSLAKFKQPEFVINPEPEVT
jgi:hypothetical protein